MSATKAILKSPWTSVGGIVAAVGVGLTQAPHEQIPDWARGVGTLLTLAGPLVIGFAARDSGTSSEKAGAK